MRIQTISVGSVGWDDTGVDARSLRIVLSDGVALEISDHGSRLSIRTSDRPLDIYPEVSNAISIGVRPR